MIGAEDFIARPEFERARHDVKSDGHVLRINHIPGISAEVGGKRTTRSFHQIIVAAAQKFYGLTFQFPLPALIFAEDWFGGRTKRAVVEESHFRVEQELAFL